MTDLNHIKALLEKDRLDLVFRALASVLENTTDHYLKNQLIQLQAQYASTQNMYLSGQISPAERETQLVTLRLALLEHMETCRTSGLWKARNKIRFLKLIAVAFALCITAVYVSFLYTHPENSTTPATTSSGTVFDSTASKTLIISIKPNPKDTTPARPTPKNLAPAPETTVFVVLNSALKDAVVFVDGVPHTGNGSTIRKISVSAGENHVFRVGTTQREVMVPYNSEKPFSVMFE